MNQTTKDAIQKRQIEKGETFDDIEELADFINKEFEGEIEVAVNMPHNSAAYDNLIVLKELKDADIKTANNRNIPRRGEP